jgi:flagellar biosynthesis GTPase FlhF
MSETRTYRGGSLEELLPRIRAELGDDAVVVRQREGLTGGVAGFFQRRTVEIEARRGQSSLGVEWFAGDPDEEGAVTPSPRFTTVPDTVVPEPPAAAAPPPPAAQPDVVAAASAPFVPPPPEPEPDLPGPPSSPFAAYLNAASATPDPAPSPAGDGVPEAVPSALAGDAFPNAEELMRDALAARRREAPVAAEQIVTSPQVDAIPVPEPEPVAQAPEPEPLPSAAPAPPSPAPAPPSAAPAPPPAASVVASAVPRPQAARHLITTLTARGLRPELAATVVDDALLHRLPLEPVATLPHAVAAQLAARIPVASLSGPAARTLVLAGALGSGAQRLVAGIAAAYATRTTVDVACIALRTHDGGRALAGALAPLGIPVHAATDGTEAADHVRRVGPDALVLIDTPPVTTDDAAALARDLAGLGPHELHLALGPGGAPTAAALLRILRPARIALGDPADPRQLGAALQAVIDAGCPIAFVAGPAAAGRPDLAVHPADAFALARELTA